MVKTILRVVQQLLRRLATRVILIASLALLALGASVVTGPVVPDRLIDALGVDSLDTILNILASSMLAVTTFSLSILTGAIQFASSSITPRTRLVLRDDTVTNMVLSNFVGAFVFALIGIVLRATPFMGEAESAMLFLFTVVVVIVVIVSILRWIDHLATLGAMDQTVTVFEKTASQVMKTFARRPALGGHVVTRDEIAAQEDHTALTCTASGYVEQLFEDILQAEADAAAVDVYLAVYPGDYVVPGMPLAYVKGIDTLDDDTADGLRSGIQITATRRFDQDPRLAVIVLTEVASRALSPGINDSQTAIDVIHRLTSVLLQSAPEPVADEVDNPRLFLAPPEPEAFFRDSFDVIARDGADKAEVVAALRNALNRLGALGAQPVREAAQSCRSRLVG